MSADIETRAGGRSSFCAAVVRFLGKLVFFAGMTGIGYAGGSLLPRYDDANPLAWTNLVLMGPALLVVTMLLCGPIGIAVTLFTAGRKPRWN